MITTTLLTLFTVGFITFFATGLDDTIAYAPFMRTHKAKWMVSSGIVTATIIDIIIAVLIAGQIQKLPYTHYIGGAGLILLGAWIIWGKGMKPHPKVKMFTKHPNHFNQEKVVGAGKLFFLGFITFFLTGLDDTLAYSILLTRPGALIGITAGIFTATFVDLLLVFYVSEKMKKLKHTKLIGGGALIALGILIALEIL